jgi:hypothetical protein
MLIPFPTKKPPCHISTEKLLLPGPATTMHKTIQPSIHRIHKNATFFGAETSQDFQKSCRTRQPETLLKVARLVDSKLVKPTDGIWRKL